MGAWGTGIFENDTACDWAYGLKDVEDLSLIESALDAVFEEEYVESYIACEALAAMETLARLNGNGDVENSYTETVDMWVSSVHLKVSSELLDKANNALTMILGPSSELQELWAESEEFSAWQKELESLKARMNA